MQEHHNVMVPKIRRRPQQTSQEHWAQYVESLFPKYTTATHQLNRIVSDSAVIQFDVSPISHGESNTATHRVTLRGERHGDNHCTCAAFQYGIYGLCPHILFVVSQLQTSRDAGLLSPDRPYSEIYLRHGLKNEIVFRPSPNAPHAVLKAARHCFDNSGTLMTEHPPDLRTLIERAAACRHELRIDNEVFALIAFQSQQKERHRQVIATFRRGANSKAFDSLLTAPLATYQREAALNAAIAGRFLLFDSPGLGRRRTAVAAAEILAKTTGVRRVLVLTNTATLHTWQLELQQSTKRKSHVIWGNPAKRSELYGADVQYAIAGYNDLQADISAITGRMKPDLIILDETHTLKRYGAETARIVRRLESDFLFVLSGADPVRVPGPFVSFVDMIDRWHTGLLDAFLMRHQQFDLQKKTLNYTNMGRVAKTLPQHFRRFESAEYRRSLPELIEHDRFLPLTEPQAKLHADLQNKLFHLATPWREAVAEYKKRLAEKNVPPSVGPEASPAIDPNATPQQDKVTDGTKTEISQDTTSKDKSPIKPVVVPLNTLHAIQATIADMSRTANDMSLIDPAQRAGYKIDAMFELLQEHLESPHVKAVVFSHDLQLLNMGQERLAKAPIESGRITCHTPLPNQKNLGTRFFREPNFRVLFVGDGVSERLVLRNVQLVIHLDFPWNNDLMRLRHATVSPHPTWRPCHAYRLLSYGTIEHWLSKLRSRGHEFFLDSDLRDRQSVTLFDESDRVKFFDQVISMLEQVKEAPMVMSLTASHSKISRNE